MPCLVLKKAGKDEFIFPLNQKVVAIGRDIGNKSLNEISLSGQEISRYHAAIFQDEDGCYHLQDLGSKNGTLINGKLTYYAPLNYGDEITVGKCTLIFKKDDVDKGKIKKTKPPLHILDDKGGKKTKDTVTSFFNLSTSPHDLIDLQISPQKLILLYQLSQIAHSSLELHSILRKIGEVVFEFLGAENGFIALVDEKTKEMEYVVKFPIDSSDIKVSRTMLEMVVRKGEAIFTFAPAIFFTIPPCGSSYLTFKTPPPTENSD